EVGCMVLRSSARRGLRMKSALPWSARVHPAMGPFAMAIERAADPECEGGRRRNTNHSDGPCVAGGSSISYFAKSRIQSTPPALGFPHGAAAPGGGRAMNADVNSHAAPRRVPLRHVVAVFVGNGLEFYDFLTFSYFAVYISRTFYPSG